MAEIIIIALLALTLALLGATAALSYRALGALGRIEAALRALAGRAAPSQGERTKEDAEQERYQRGVANILAYGTRELLRRGGEAQ